MTEQYHKLSPEESLNKLNSSLKKGIKSSKINERKKEYGANILPKSKQIEILKLIWDQLKSPLIWILCVASLLILIIEDYPQSLMEAGFIWGTILINTTFGFWQEFKANNVLKSLQEYDQPEVLTIRDGHKKTVLQQNLVVGDIVILQAGDKIPADGRVLKSNNLKISEAVLTGESVAIEKNNKSIKKELPIFEQKNMVFRGTIAEKGSGKILITAVGKDTEIGRIASLVQNVGTEESPLQEKMKSFVKTLAIAMIGLTITILAIGVMQGRDLVNMFETSLAIVTGGIPEALPIITALILAIGMKKLAEKKGIVRKLSSVETLGSTTIICCDKTKTLTTGVMKAVRFTDKKQGYDLKTETKNLNEILKLLGLANSGTVEDPQNQEVLNIIGDPTDRAITKLVYQNGFYLDDNYQNNKFKNYELIKSLDFNSNRGYQSKIYKYQNQYIQIILGMPEKLIALDKQNHKYFKERNKELTQKGYRVICLATKHSNSPQNPNKLENIKIQGLLCLQDPLREGVKESLKQAEDAGAKVIMITGDHQNTALSIAKELGMNVNENQVLLGKELEKLSFDKFVENINQYKVYARIQPENKMKIVKAWQSKGEVVAMTGDGVNDGPAIKQADIGIAVGSGTEVAKQSSDLVLLNDSFSIIIEAINQGRVILDNIRKATTYVLADSLASIVLVGMSLIFKLPLPILWQQILWNNLVEDSFPNIAFAFEPPEEGILKRKPEKKDNSLLTRPMKELILVVGIFDQLLTFGLFYILYRQGFNLDYIRTMVFGSLVMDTGFVIYSFKNLRKNIWEYNILNNKHLLASSLLVFGGFAIALYFPFIRNLLGTVPLSAKDWGIQILMSLSAVLLTEIGKYVFIKKRLI